ncbi:hypothetical protein TNCV_2874291 [Trichonephila clavipes]|nr:hypothetical protein TNCV_2874291 [Trichonephila clavipes]
METEVTETVGPTVPQHWAAPDAFTQKLTSFLVLLRERERAVESDQNIIFKFGKLSAFIREFTSLTPTLQAINSRRGILRDLRGATLDFALASTIFTLESIIDRTKTHAAYALPAASTKTCNSEEKFTLR